MQGWIKLHRRIIDHWVWQDPEYLRMWIYLLLDVNHEDRKILWNKDVITVKRGQKITSQKKLSNELKCTRGTTRHFLGLLERDSMIELNCNQHYTQITICNYDDYQLPQPTKNQQTTNGQPTDNQQTDTNKNYKKGKNDIKDREANFKKELEGYGDKYNVEMLRAFFNYWSEPNKSKTKMKCEMQQTWDTAKRLATWHSRSKK